MKVYLSKQHLDTKQMEILNSLLLRDLRVKVVENELESDFTIIDAREINCDLRRDRYIACAFGDILKYTRGVDTQDALIRQYVRKNKKTIIFLGAQWDEVGRFRHCGKIDDFIVLTVPLLLGGSAKNIYYPDNDGDYLFSKCLSRNNSTYKYDWSWIGYPSSYGRKMVFKYLDEWDYGGAYFYKVTTHIKAKKSDTRVNADIPINQCMEIFKQSKVNISCNGRDPFCLKDGELLCRNCFVLRQHHPHLDLNPLTPKDGKHWIIFKDTPVPYIKYFLKNELDREDIADTGYEYFRDGIMGEWARYYVDRFEDFLRTKNKESFGKLLYIRG